MKKNKFLESNTFANIIATLALIISIISLIYNQSTNSKLREMQLAENSPIFSVQYEDFDTEEVVDGTVLSGGQKWTFKNTGNTAVKNVSITVWPYLEIEISGKVYYVNIDPFLYQTDFDYSTQEKSFYTDFDIHQEVYLTHIISSYFGDKNKACYVRRKNYVEISYDNMYGNNIFNRYVMNGNYLVEIPNNYIFNGMFDSTVRIPKNQEIDESIFDLVNLALKEQGYEE